MSFFNYQNVYLIFKEPFFPMMDFPLGMGPEEVSKSWIFLACGVLNYLELEMGLLEG